MVVLAELTLSVVGIRARVDFECDEELLDSLTQGHVFEISRLSWSHRAQTINNITLPLPRLIVGDLLPIPPPSTVVPCLLWIEISFFLFIEQIKQREHLRFPLQVIRNI